VTTNPAPGTITASIWQSGYGTPSPIVGAAVRCIALVTDVDGDPVNPDTLSITFRAQGQTALGPFTYTFPGGDPSSTVTYTGTAGSFFADYTLPNSGVWTYQWHAYPSSGLDTTATDAIVEGEIVVSNSGV